MAISEWNTNPVLIRVETTDYPVENILFPTVTICREDNSIDSFQFITKMLDYINFPCFEDGWDTDIC